MGLAATEAELQEKLVLFLKAELKRGKMTYSALAERLADHGLPGETENSIKSKLKRGAFAATFLVAAVAAIGLEGIQLEDL